MRFFFKQLKQFLLNLLLFMSKFQCITNPLQFFPVQKALNTYLKSHIANRWVVVVMVPPADFGAQFKLNTVNIMQTRGAGIDTWPKSVRAAQWNLN